MSGFYRSTAERVEQREPPDGGRVLARCPRGRDGAEELRLAVREYEGHEFIDLRVWVRGREGDGWFPTKKGVSVRRGEIVAIGQGLRAAWRELCGGASNDTGERR